MCAADGMNHKEGKYYVPKIRQVNYERLQERTYSNYENRRNYNYGN